MWTYIWHINIPDCALQYKLSCTPQCEVHALNNWSMCSAADMVGESYVLASSPGRTFKLILTPE